MASMRLHSWPVRVWARLCALEVEAALAARLGALGVREGARLLVLRRAPFGGPLHVRLGSGLELALERDVASRLEVEGVDASTPGAPRGASEAGS
jgi:ferrous iron transport protein A